VSSGVAGILTQSKVQILTLTCFKKKLVQKKILTLWWLVEVSHVYQPVRRLARCGQTLALQRMRPA
jgi:hypothetical protein